jgi:hypothetical protein
MATITSIPGNQVIFVEQTSVTRYVALAETAGGFALPDASGSSDRHFLGVRFPGVTAVPAVIYYRTRHTGKPSFSVRINDATLTQFTDADPPERCWHEIIPANLASGPVLKPQNNELIFGIGIRNHGDSLIVGDVVIFYTSNQTTIEVPVVVTTNA